jgi:pimeloyl-ACP methyl ester carboxylesterase
VKVPQAALDDLRRRLQATRWPDKETVADQSQGAQLANLQQLVGYWGTGYDWRKAEAKLNAYSQFVTTIDDVDVHFIHVRSRHRNAMPVIIAHGWPGSIFEQVKLIDPLIEPTKYGGRAADAFDVVIPSLPGYGFSSRPTETGWDVERIGRAFDLLMKRLGYTRYVAQGGDWGAGVVEAMARQAPEGLLGIHTNLPAVFPPSAAAAIASGGQAPEGLSDKERAAFDDVNRFIQSGGWGYYQMMTARPQAVGYGLTDSPAGLAGWMLVHGGFGKWTYGKDSKQSPTVDEVLRFTVPQYDRAKVYGHGH